MVENDEGRVRRVSDGAEQPRRAEAPLAASVREARPAPRPTVPADPCIRAENEDDDGYDPYSDRRPAPEPLFERDPWA